MNCTQMNQTPTTHRPTRPARQISLGAVLFAAVLAVGCSTQVIRHPVAPTYQPAPAVAQASVLAGNDAALSGQARQDNANRIARLLAQLDDTALSREAAALPVGDPLYNFAGRALLNRGLPLPRPFDRAGNWNFDAGNRPPAEPDGYRPPVRMAVLLPLSGSLSRAAAPVRDGFLSGYYGEQRRRPQVRFYDTSGTAGGAISAYGRAVADGSDFVVGPLSRDAVGALFHQRLSVPVLALNRVDAPPPAGNASFSLAPEDDGIAAAEFLLARNARHVLVIDGGGDSMRRAIAAFTEQMQGRGGDIAVTLPVGAQPGDISGALRGATQAPGGIDAVFLAVTPEQARDLAPQLSLAGLAGKPRVATSQFADAGEAATDHGLDGIAFPSQAWDVRGVSGLPSAASAADMLSSARGPASRLFAFGHDAWLLTAYLEHLATMSGAKVQGATGDLRIDGFGNVMRTPAWSTYSGAAVLPLGLDHD